MDLKDANKKFLTDTLSWNSKNKTFISLISNANLGKKKMKKKKKTF